LLPISRQNLERAGKTLNDVIEEVARQSYSDLAPAIDRVWDDGIDSIRVDLREWLRRASEDGSGYVPWRFELSFGLADSVAQRLQSDPQSTSKAVDLDCGIRLRGSIDLVERHSGGHIRITDHKTGKADGEDGQIIAGGKSSTTSRAASRVNWRMTGGALIVGSGLKPRSRTDRVPRIPPSGTDMPPPSTTRDSSSLRGLGRARIPARLGPH
jgi:PD-(D/E)XK nuclease superfamily